MIKVLIADDQELIRQSLSIILGLKEEISVVGGVGSHFKETRRGS